MLRAVSSQEIAHQRRNLIVSSGGGRMDPVQKTAERRCELAGLMVWRLIGHGLDPPASTAATGSGTRSRAYRRAFARALASPPPSATCSPMPRSRNSPASFRYKGEPADYLPNPDHLR